MIRHDRPKRHTGDDHETNEDLVIVAIGIIIVVIAIVLMIAAAIV